MTAFSKYLPLWFYYMNDRSTNALHTNHLGPANRSVVALAYDNLCVFEFAVAAEIFGLGRPELGVGWYDFAVVAAEPGPLRALGGVSVTTTAARDRIEQAGTVVLPGWRSRGTPPPPDILDALRIAHDRGARLVSFCSGAFALAETGLLDGQAATTHWLYADELQSRYPRIDVRPDVLYVDNGSLLTSAGSAAGIDLGLHLVRRDYGPEIANTVARRLVVPAHRDGGQAQFIPQPVTPEDDAPIAATLAWALERLDQPLTVAQMANHATLSERTFNRRFAAATGSTPHRWLTHNRVSRARDLLETTSLSIERVAESSGLGSAANLRNHFGRELLTTPTRYRQTFARWHGPIEEATD